MPAQIPPEAQSIGRARGRLSASSLTTFVRCQKQWFLNYKIGLRGPLSPHQVMGIEVEDALCTLLMKRPPKTDSFDSLKEWILSLVPSAAEQCLSKGKTMFEQALWSKGDFDESFSQQLVEQYLKNGLDLQLEEVKACFEADGGLHEFEIPAPCFEMPPHYAMPNKANSKLKWPDNPHQFSDKITWDDAWEIARPWVKDPRNPQPQRMYHADKWAAGECDLVLRWDGKNRIIDIKIGDGEGKFASSLTDQLNFYAWLWNQTHDSTCEGLEGWYLTNGLRKIIDVNPESTEYYKDILSQMQSFSNDNSLPLAQPCDGTKGGCYWCGLSEIPYIVDELKIPYEPLSSIPNRVNVKGKLQGAWGPLPNHYGEPVLGAMIQAGAKMVTLEESQPGAYPLMHDAPSDEVIITGALPGVWRRQPRLYLDEQSAILVESDVELTRMGMLRTKANVRGIVLCISKRDGIRADGKPWSMMTFHLWDGERVAEVVAFGSAINGTMLSIRPGDTVGLTAVELGWREGLVQLRIDTRTTRIEVKSKD